MPTESKPTDMSQIIPATLSHIPPDRPEGSSYNTRTRDPVYWNEVACLIYCDPRRKGPDLDRLIVAEETLSKIAPVLSNVEMNQWCRYTIHFPERKTAPFVFEHTEFMKYVVAPYLQVKWLSQSVVE